MHGASAKLRVAVAHPSRELCRELLRLPENGLLTMIAHHLLAAK